MFKKIAVKNRPNEDLNDHMDNRLSNKLSGIRSPLLVLCVAAVTFACVYEDEVLPTSIPLTETLTKAAPVIPEISDEEFFAAAPIDYETVWTRIESGYAIEADYEHRLVKSELEWYGSHPEYIDRVLRRSAPFIHHILNEIEKEGLPTELVLLPIVESAYQPFAYSHGRAAGIWQFIPSTGRIYGLKQNWWYDGRRDIIASTRAAIKYLKNLNKIFKGDWLHALAAYNAGSGNVRKAIRKNKRKGRPTDFWHLKLPAETRTYVPKLLAIKKLLSNPEPYGVTLPCMQNIAGFTVVDAESQIDLALAADMADIDLETLYRYNPGYNRWATPPDGPHTFALPIEAAELFTESMAILPKNKRVAWKRHKIRNGETLSTVARKYRTTVKHLRRVNSMRNTRIRAGKHLLIPVASKHLSNYTLSASQRTRAIQNSKYGKSGKTRITHTVQTGESFWTISRKYGVGMHKLARWNGLAVRDKLRIGQHIVVWKANNPASSRLSSRKPSQTIQSISYIVRIGDSLSRIAGKFRVSVADLHRWNRIRGKYLKPGQRIKLFVDITEQAGG